MSHTSSSNKVLRRLRQRRRFHHALKAATVIYLSSSSSHVLTNARNNRPQHLNLPSKKYAKRGVAAASWTWNEQDVEILGKAIVRRDDPIGPDEEEEGKDYFTDLIHGVNDEEEDILGNEVMRYSDSDSEKDHAMAMAASAWLQDARKQKAVEQEKKDRKMEVDANNTERESSGPSLKWFQTDNAVSPNNVQRSSTRSLEERLNYDINEDTKDIEEAVFKDDKSGYQDKKHPIVYRYFGRGRARRRTETSVPFILLGENVDHWTKLAEALSAKGFNVIACELRKDVHDAQDGPDLVATLLDTLRWRKAIVVGCDKIGAMASIEAADELGPNEVAGLVLVGDLTGLRPFLLDEMPELDPKHPRLLEEFILRYVECPSTILWDGHVLKKKSVLETNLLFPTEAYDSLRCVVHGGGDVPHRRTPEQVAWIFSRFVEQKVVGRQNQQRVRRTREKDDIRLSKEFRKNHPNAIDSLPGKAILFGLDVKDTIMSKEAVVVSGRLLAYALSYIAFGKAAVAQYRTFQKGVSAVQLSVHQLNKWQHQLFVFLTDLFLKDWKRKLRFLQLIISPIKLVRFPMITLRRNKIAGATSGNDEQTKQELESNVDPYFFKFGGVSV